ncbi:MAG: SDR family NAD(P)-dependent oxidoreductase [Chloroflexi bacterium]|nr:SDR family NAD(P)-dependent oxidoreductase [Chloroflexota bacterium]
MHEFQDKVAVVTGAGSGMGRAFAERFAREGMKVVLADIEQAALDEAVAELRARHHDVLAVQTDVMRFGDLEALAHQTLDAYGAVHLVCNNAGVEGYLDGALWEASAKDWEWTVGVNFWGVVNGVRAFLPLMLAQNQEGHVVNTASATGLVRASNMYAITKHAVRALSEALYGQLKQRGARIGVSVLCPGVVNTRLFAGERNRPPELRDDQHPDGPRPSNAVRRGWFERARQSMAPPEVADILVQAIREERFYVYTDHEWDDRMQAFCHDLVNGANPVLQPAR